MTVVYNSSVATAKGGLGNFWRLLFRWVGSIYKLVFPDLGVYMILYYAINIPYRIHIVPLPANDTSKIYFHALVKYSREAGKLIPLQFILGFYVSQVVTRWWQQFWTLPWPDNLSVTVASAVRGHDDRGRLMRRTIVRYINTALVMVFTMISPQARSRFPTLDDLVNAGFLVPHERLILEHLNEKTPGPKYYVPIVWAGAVAARARKEGRIRDDISLYHIIKQICIFRSMAIDLLSYDWLSIPMVYTQVTTLATYVYFLSCLMSRQMIQIDDTKSLDLYVPVFLIMEFLFMLGWLKVAETMINPFGEDDDDFEVNWLIDRNITVCYVIVDEINNEFPEMIRDNFWAEGIPEELLYTRESLKYKTEGMGEGSAAVKRKEEEKHHHDILTLGPESLPRRSIFNILVKKHQGMNTSKSEEEIVAQLLEKHKLTEEYKDSDEKLETRPSTSTSTDKKRPGFPFF